VSWLLLHRVEVLEILAGGTSASGIGLLLWWLGWRAGFAAGFRQGRGW
jgi:hypothetical protein